jgi:hypothetical protein
LKVIESTIQKESPTKKVFYPTIERETSTRCKGAAVEVAEVAEVVEAEVVVEAVAVEVGVAVMILIRLYRHPFEKIHTPQ